MIDLEADPERASAICREAQARLVAALSGLTDSAARAPSRLPGWSRGHLLTHLARNADAHARRLAGSLRGEDVAKYAGGPDQRQQEIEAGADRPAAELVADLIESQQRLEDVLARCAAAGWPGSDLIGANDYPPTASPAHRVREVEVHHVDLGLGYEPADWPSEYVAWDLPVLLRTVAERLPEQGQRVAALAWITGRAPMPSRLDLDPL